MTIDSGAPALVMLAPLIAARDCDSGPITTACTRNGGAPFHNENFCVKRSMFSHDGESKHQNIETSTKHASKMFAAERPDPRPLFNNSALATKFKVIALPSVERCRAEFRSV